MRTRRLLFFPILSVLTLVPAVSSAQNYEDVGTRAKGMGGAFVAVADDATAVWWNPAGLARGPFLSAVAEGSHLDEPADRGADHIGRRTASGGFAITFPSLGLSYYQFRISEIVANSTEPLVQTRQEDGAAGLGVQSRAVRQVGVTVGQSLGDHIVIGSTLKVMHGGGGTDDGNGGGDLWDVADDLSFAQKTKFDLDLGVLATAGGLQFGASVRNLTAPDFGDELHPVKLERQARAGAALIHGPAGVFTAFTLSGDIDLTEQHSVFGGSQRVAGGAEGWLLHRHLGLRGGLSRNLVDREETAWSGGASVMVVSGFALDAAVTRGTDDALSGWSVSARVTF